MDPRRSKLAENNKSFKQPSISMSLHKVLTNDKGSGKPLPKALSTNGSDCLAVPNGNKRQRQDSSTRSDTEVCPIQVVIRCRGRYDYEHPDNREPGIKVNKDLLDELQYKTRHGENAEWETYQFDRVYGSTTPQRNLYDETVSPILAQVLEGYNCTIFAYGQTGTGKTHTMEGDLNDVPLIPAGNAGIIPRVLHYLFEALNLETKEVMTVVKLSMVEIYNEEVYDLLTPPHQFAGVGVSSQSSLDLPKLTLNLDVNQNLIIKGLKEHIVLNKEEGVNYLSLGSSRRHTASTKLNKISSRSHSIFTLTIHSHRTTSNGEKITKSGKLNLVDLAGSEDIGRSGAQNSHAAEAGKINQSLLTLGKIIKRLYDNSISPPGIKPTYRESKLTRILEDSLGGGTKTCIISTVSLAEVDLKESISTLKYASQAKAIKTRPRINISLGDAALYKEYRDENERLKQELKLARTRDGVYLSSEHYSKLQSDTQKLTNKVEELTFFRNKLETDNKDLSELQIKQSRLLVEAQKQVTILKDKLEAKIQELEKTQGELHVTTKQLEATIELKEAYRISESNLDTIAQKLSDDLDYERKRADILTQVLSVKGSAAQSNLQSSKLLSKSIGQESVSLQDHLNKIVVSQDKFWNQFQDSFTGFSSELDKFTQEIKSGLEAKAKQAKDDIRCLEGVAKQQVNGSNQWYDELEVNLDSLQETMQHKLRALFDNLNGFGNNLTKHLFAFLQKSDERSASLNSFLKSYKAESELKLQNSIDALQQILHQKEKQLQLESANLQRKKQEVKQQFESSQESHKLSTQQLLSTLSDSIAIFSAQTEAHFKTQLEQQLNQLDSHKAHITDTHHQLKELTDECQKTSQTHHAYHTEKVKGVVTAALESDEQVLQVHGIVNQEFQTELLNYSSHEVDLEAATTEQTQRCHRLISSLRDEGSSMQSKFTVATKSALNHLNTLESVQRDGLTNVASRFNHSLDRITHVFDTWANQELKPSVDRVSQVNYEHLELVQTYVQESEKNVPTNLPKLLPPRNHDPNVGLTWTTVDPKNLADLSFSFPTGNPDNPTIKRKSVTPKLSNRSATYNLDKDSRPSSSKKPNSNKSIKSEKFNG